MLPQNYIKMNSQRYQNNENININNLNQNLYFSNRLVKVNNQLPSKIIISKNKIPKTGIDKIKAQSHHKSYDVQEIKISPLFYEKEILQYLLKKDQNLENQYCLRNQTLTAELRTKMVDWMIEVMSSYKCQDQTFFYAVQLMDLFYSKIGINLDIDQLHPIGVTAMFVASKYNEIYPIKLKTFYEKISHFKITPDQIKNKEYQLLQILDFKVGNPTIYELQQSISCVLNLKNILNQFQFQIFQQTCTMISKMVVHDYDLLNEFKQKELSAAIVNLAMKIINYINPDFNYQDKQNEMLSFYEINQPYLTKISNKLKSWILSYDITIGHQFQNLKKFQTFNKDNLEILKKI